MSTAAALLEVWPDLQVFPGETRKNCPKQIEMGLVMSKSLPKRGAVVIIGVTGIGLERLTGE